MEPWTLAVMDPSLIGGGALGFLVLGLLAWQMKANAALYGRMRTEIADLRDEVDKCEKEREEDRVEREQERATYRELLTKYGNVTRSLARLQRQALRTSATLIADDTGTIINASARALALLRYKGFELVGRSAEILVPPNLLSAYQRAFNYVTRTDTWMPGPPLNGPLRRGDATTVWADIDLSRSFRRDGHWTFVIQLREQRSAQPEEADSDETTSG